MAVGDRFEVVSSHSHKNVFTFLLFKVTKFCFHKNTVLTFTRTEKISDVTSLMAVN